ncbi:phage head closure protein [Lacticaseibacillus pabuli]|uniref:Phage head closure protein n=1 Tax=Lacticaseibacillus pabuli TaxID=3025672 RepID=A0ABY7WQL4_9LACO|nr:phage head closure protein [Lacticaseibacillus sp. KACC 23028]WDF82069.1 phage head closure protein [Lacticaseibacillus sp. KACC 23028]
MALINKPSDLNIQIDIGTHDTGCNSAGVPVETFVKLFTTWAQLRTQYLSDLAKIQGTVLEDTSTFVVRHEQPQTITSKMYIQYGGAEYKITDVNADTQEFEWDTIIAKAVNETSKK